MSKSLRELEQIQQKLEYKGGTLRAFIVDVLPVKDKSIDMQDRLKELENLVNTYGGIVILKCIQKRWSPDYRSYIGAGKLDEIVQEMQQSQANLLVLGSILKPIQIYNINEKLKPIGAKAWDKVDLILKIFEKNAKTMESRLQIELASIRHIRPRIFNMGAELGSQGSGGSKLSRGKGETNTQIMKRHLYEREMQIKKQLEHYKKVRAEHRKSRLRKGLNTVGIVGYTNTGKSSLMNALTGKGVLSQDKLFATLSTSVGKMYVEDHYDETGRFINSKDILIIDTIGFIRDLPLDLVDAFASTLEDSIESSLLLHLIDASDSKLEEKIKVVDDILDRIGANQKRLYVFNKIDLISSERLKELEEKFSVLNPIFISVYSGDGIGKLKEAIIKNVGVG